MAVNKVIFGGDTIIDLTADTVTAETLAVGVTAHDKSGTKITGTMEAGSGGGEFYKAFEGIPLTNEVQNKRVAPLIAIKDVAAAYVDSQNTLSASYSREPGVTYILALALRNPGSEPIAPEGWEKIAWLEPPTGSSSNQWLFVAKTTVPEDETSNDSNVSFAVTSGQRNYLLIASIGDSNVTGEYDVISGSSISYISPSCFEHTVLVCTSETANHRDKNIIAWAVQEGYTEAVLVKFGDMATDGGRLSMLYVPWKSEQPYESPVITIIEDGTETSGAIVCSLEISPGTITKYACYLGQEGSETSLSYAITNEKALAYDVLTGVSG